MLVLEDVHAGYGHITVLKGISLKVDKGAIVALLGANGAGKSTTLKVVSGLLHAVRGRVTFDGVAIGKERPDRIVRRGIAMVPEGRELFLEMTVAENLEMGAYSRRDRARVREDTAIVFDLFPRLRERRGQIAGTLSGGEQQMLAIGRALMARPSLLLLDEPSLGLAPAIVDEIFDRIEQIHREGTAILLVEQNARMALDIADTAYVLETGRVALSGPAHELMTNVNVQASYLGRDGR